MRFSTPWAIIIGSLIAPLVLLIGAKLIGEPIWLALTAVGTIGAVISALYFQLIKEWFQKPNLQFIPFQQKPPYFRKAPYIERKTGKKVSEGYSINIPLNNMGKNTAKNCQPVITSMGTKIEDKWLKDKNWLPKTLFWSFEGSRAINLIPERPITFSLAALNTIEPDLLTLRDAYPTTGQKYQFQPGEYFFEVKVFAEPPAKPIVTYIQIHWKGGATENYEEVQNQIAIQIKDKPPW